MAGPWWLRAVLATRITTAVPLLLSVVLRAEPGLVALVR
jgi:hypothetical protein